VFPDYQVELR